MRRGACVVRTGRFKSLLALPALLAFSLLAHPANAKTEKFVYVYDAAGTLLSPANAAAQCPDPAGGTATAARCQGVAVNGRGNYSVEFENGAVPSAQNLIFVSNLYQVASKTKSGTTEDAYILLDSKRRVDAVESGQVNNGVDINAVSEATVVALEKIKNLPHVEGAVDATLATAAATIDADALNSALSNGQQDNATESHQRALIDTNQDELTEAQQQTLVALATLAIEEQGSAPLQDYLRKSLSQALTEPALLDEIAERVYSHLSGLQADGTQSPTVLLEADRYVLSPATVARLNTSKSIDATRFFAYTWYGAESDTANAEFSRGEPGSYLVCATGEIDDGNNSSTDCVRLLIKGTVEAIAYANLRRVPIGATVQLSGARSVGAVAYAWSGPGSFMNVGAADTAWVAPSVPGSYTLALTVNGEYTDSVVIDIYDLLPVAIATADRYSVYLNGSDDAITLTSGSIATDGSDVDSLLWEVIAKPEGSQPTLSSADSTVARLLGDQPGLYTVRLTATKNGISDSTELTVQLRMPGMPVALAGADQITYRNQSVQLDGSRSYATEGKSLSAFQWSAANGGVLSTPTQSTTNFVADLTAAYPVKLTVSDGSQSATDELIVEVRNRLPIASDTVYANLLNEVLQGQLPARDGDGDALTYTLLSQPSSGGVTVDPQTGAFVYVPGGDKGCRYRPYAQPTANGQGGLDVPVIKLCADRYEAAPGQTIHLTTSNSINASKFSGYQWSEGVVPDAGEITQATFTPTAPGNYKVCVVGNIGQSNNTSTACVDLVVKTNPADPGAVYGGYTERVQFQVTDGRDVSNIATVILTIGWQNTVPAVENLSLSTQEDTAVSGQLAASDLDGHTLRYELVGNGARGTAVITDAARGTFSYTPHENANGTDQFTYVAYDGLQYSAEATVTVTIGAVQDAPVAYYAGSLRTTEDHAVSGVLGGIDNDGDALDFRLVSQAGKGSVQITDRLTGAFTYTPNADASGSDSFHFLVNDGHVDSNLALVNIVVDGVNDAPRAADAGPLSTPEDQALLGNLSGSDPDGDTITYVLVSQPASGTVTLTDAATGSFTYTPRADLSGSDSFTFKVRDGELESAPATVALTITPVNDAPTAADQALATDEDAAVAGALSATDPEGDGLRFAIVTNPGRGNVALDPATGAFTYTPAADANGSDSFTFRANDGALNSTTATVRVTITAVNDRPVAEGGSIETHSDTPISGSVRATDVDRDALVYSIKTAPTKGSVELSAATGAYQYVPRTAGSDAFTFVASDGRLESAAATVNINVLPSNVAPVATAQNIVVLEGVAYAGSLLGSDADSAILSYSIVENGRLGTATVTNAATGTFTFQARTAGNDYFVFRVSDGDRYADATVLVTVRGFKELCAGPSSEPADADRDGYADFVEIAFNTSTTNALETPAGLDPQALAVSFTDDDDSDGYADAVELWLGSDPRDVNSKPTASTSTGLPTCLTVDGDTQPPVLKAFSVLTPTVTASSGSAVAEFALTVLDNAAGVADVQLVLEAPSGARMKARLTPSDAPRVLYGQLVTGAFSRYAEAGAWTVVELKVTDVAGHILRLGTADLANRNYPTTLTVVNTESDAQAPALSSVTILTPSMEVSGGSNVASFGFTVTDNRSGVAYVDIKVKGPTGQYRWGRAYFPPTQTSVTGSLSTGFFDQHDEPGIWQLSEIALTDHAGNVKRFDTTALRVLGWQTDIVVTNLNIDTLAPRLLDLQVLTPTIDANCLIRPKYSVSAADDGTGIRDIVVLLQGPGGAQLLSTYSSLDRPKNVTAEIQSDACGSLAAGEWIVAFVSIVDGRGNTGYWYTNDLITKGFNTRVIVAGLPTASNNHAPVASGASLTGTEDMPLSGTLQAYDADGDALTYQLVSNPTKGSVAITDRARGLFTYTPNANATGNDSFSFQVNDGQTASNTATIAITLYPENDAPLAEDMAITVVQPEAYTGMLQGSDPDSGTLSFRIVSNGSLGTVTLINSTTGSFRYVPNPGSAGTDSFTFEVSDNGATSHVATVSVSVKAEIDLTAFTVLTPVINRNQADATVRAAVTLSVEPGRVLGIWLTLAGPNGQTIEISRTVYSTMTYPIELSKLVGSTLAEGEWRFTGLRVQKATNLTMVQVTSDISARFAATVRVVRNQAPLASTDQALSTTLTQAVSGVFAATDADDDRLTYRIVDAGRKGTAMLTDATTGAFSYTPSTDGTDTVTFVASDGINESNVGAVSITIRATNGVPVAFSYPIAVTRNLAYIDTLRATDTDGDPLLYSIVSAPRLGTLELVDAGTGKYVYRPRPDQVGDDSFSFRVTDGMNESNVGTVSITIGQGDGTPVANADAITVFEGIAYGGRLSGSDPDGQNLSFSVVSAPALGNLSVDGATGSYVYTPIAGRLGQDSFTFAVSDGKHTSVPATISIKLISTAQACGSGGIVTGADLDHDGWATIIETEFVTRYDDAASTPAGLNAADLGISYRDDDDDDGVADYAEIWLGSDPNDALSLATRSTLSGLPDCFTPASDGIKPRLLGFDVATRTVDPSADDVSVGYVLSLSDNASGLKRVRISLVSPSGAFLTSSASFADYPLVHALELRSPVLPVHAEQGTWQVANITVYDEAGNRLSLSTSELRDAGFPVEVQVSNAGSDAAAPALTGLTILTPEVYPAAGGARMRFELSVTDNLSGLASARLDLTGPSGTVVTAALTLPTADTSATIQLETAVLSTYLEQGQWQVQGLLLTDAAGNSVQLADQLQPRGYPRTLQVTNPFGDSVGPSLVAFSVLTADVYPANGAARMSFAVQATDNAAGFAKITVEIHGPSGQSVQAVGSFTSSYPTSTTAQINTATLSTLLEAGVWTVEAVELLDEAGNRTRVTRDALAAIAHSVDATVRY